MDFEILDKKIRRLQCKLKKYNVDLEIFEQSDIVYGDVLGKGGEGVVQKCSVRYSGIFIDAAIKTVNAKDDDGINLTLDEIELLCLASDHIIDCTLRVYGVAAIHDLQDDSLGHLVIVTEAGLMNALQLYQDEEVPLYVTYDLWGRIAGAVYCLHNKKIIHHDLKPENILITCIFRDKSGHIEKLWFKIIDFGMGRRCYTKKIVTDDILGTNGYHPPEVLSEDSYDFRADIFMLGVTFSVLLHAKSFLKSNQFQNLLRKLHTSKKRGLVGHDLYETVLEHNIDHHEDISPLIKSMLCNMLETQEYRDVALQHVVDICREECEREKSKSRMLPAHISPCNGQDSGFGSGLDGSAESFSKRQPVRRVTRSCSISSSRSEKRPSRRRKKTESISSTATSPDSPDSERIPRQLRPRKQSKAESSSDSMSPDYQECNRTARLRPRKPINFRELSPVSSAPSTPEEENFPRLRSRKRESSPSPMSTAPSSPDFSESDHTPRLLRPRKPLKRLCRMNRVT